MRFMGSKFTQNALAADPAGGAKAIPQTPCRFQGAASRQGKMKGGEKGRRERRKGVLGRKEGREGKGRRRERERESLRHWR